uniref:Uncharacterized protein n=1 Tax=Nonomuraea gerenzanensis TaxID=93944 RepID=A0A1M4E1G6_9ACTN|nr:hypothetical protein BN4615_P2137 [Nonomuraea gerenzanensis]
MHGRNLPARTRLRAPGLVIAEARQSRTVPQVRNNRSAISAGCASAADSRGTSPSRRLSGLRSVPRSQSAVSGRVSAMWAPCQSGRRSLRT